MMNIKENKVTVCDGNICVTVFGELAAALAVVVLIGVTAVVLTEVAKIAR
jgi:hypothetical protein